MDCNLHHVHLFASDLDASLHFYQEMFGAKVIFDEIAAGARNVMIQIGKGRINFYDQPPRGTGPSAVHHLGINTEDISGVVSHMEAKGFHFRNPVRDFGELKYVMLEGPDQVLIEIFETSPTDSRCRL